MPPTPERNFGVYEVGRCKPSVNNDMPFYISGGETDDLNMTIDSTNDRSLHVPTPQTIVRESMCCKKCSF